MVANLAVAVELALAVAVELAQAVAVALALAGVETAIAVELAMAVELAVASGEVARHEQAEPLEGRTCMKYKERTEKDACVNLIKF